MCDLFGPILEVIKFVGRPARKYFTYHRKFNEYVVDFKQAQEDLLAWEADIQRQLQEEQHRFGKMPKQEVESWFKKVEEKTSHARGVEDKVSQGRYLFRSCLGKLVEESTQAMKEVYAEGHFSRSLVLNDPSSMLVKLPTPELVGDTEVTEEIYKYLMGDEVGMIGVCGMGGIGKTTIMKHVYNRLLKETKFSKLIWTTLSKDFDIRKLQKGIASQLMENLSDDEDTIIRAAKLSEMLRKQGRYVLILDDVWESFSLEDVGILEPTADNGCKLVLTTRSEEVVRSMGCKKVQVSCLSMDEAIQLFLSKVGQDMLPTLESIMRLVVRECDGLPLAIVTVAGCMRGILDPDLWEDARNQLREHIRNIQDMKEKVFGCLKFSYDRLEQIDQGCFLCCAMYPEDWKVEKDKIIEYWIQEGLIEEMATRKTMHVSGHSILQKFEENYLLEKVMGGAKIKMHDVVRDMALHITRKRFLVKAGKQLEEFPNEEEWIEDLEKVSLMYNSISTIPPNMKSPKCPKLTTLLLSENSLEQIPESFFDHIPNLKILDLSNNPIVNLPYSVSNLENLTTLLLRDCEHLENLPSFLKLQALKKLDLRGSSIKEIPQGLEMLVNLRYLNLGFNFSLEEISNGLLSKLCRLQYLATHPAPTKENVRKLNKLEVFEGCLTNVHDLNMYAGQRKQLHKYLIWVSQKLIGQSFYSDIDYSKMVAFVGFDINSEDAIILPCDIQQLQVHDCKGMRSLNDISGLKDATALKECTIQDCDELESIFSSSCQLQALESLDLQNLRQLKAMVGESSLVGTFSFLKEISLWDCGHIKNLFSAKWLPHNLEKISVRDCGKMEEIVVSEGEGMAANTTTKYVLPKLMTLELEDLPELKSICGKNGVIVCDSIGHIHIKFCPKLKRIPLHLSQLEPDKGKTMEIYVDSKEWWESLEWDNPNAKNVLAPFLLPTLEDVERKADEFIKKFKEQLRLQRLDSILRRRVQ